MGMLILIRIISCCLVAGSTKLLDEYLISDYAINALV